MAKVTANAFHPLVQPPDLENIYKLGAGCLHFKKQAHDLQQPNFKWLHVHMLATSSARFIG